MNNKPFYIIGMATTKLIRDTHPVGNDIDTN